ncbi:MAG: M16 family metallopeptidase [Bdellovibrionales bacterium]
MKFLRFIAFFYFKIVSANPLLIDLKVDKFTLKNGLTVLLHQDAQIPLVSYHTWYKVGSRNEAPGITGSAHMLEHMMFKGSEKYSNKDFDKIMHANGMINNAFTTYDITGFYQSLPSDKLELMMDLERDRMRNLLLKPEDLISEKEVVKEERRWRVENNPQSLLREQVMELLFKDHPYRWPVIGYMKDIAAYDHKTMRSFDEKYYGPNNSVLVIVGNIDLQKTKNLVEKYYSDLPQKNVPKEKKHKLIKLDRKHEISLEKDVQVPSLMIGYQSVPDRHPDSYALEVLAQIIANGSSSRLSKDLVYDQQIANATGAYQWALKEAGMWGLFISLKPGASEKRILTSLDQQIFKVRHQLVSEREILRAKNQFMADFVNGLSTADDKARALASAEIVTGDYKTLFTDLEKYQAVTLEDIRRVAKKYLNSNARVLAWLRPQSNKSTKEAMQ